MYLLAVKPCKSSSENDYQHQTLAGSASDLLHPDKSGGYRSHGVGPHRSGSGNDAPQGAAVADLSVDISKSILEFFAASRRSDPDCR